MVRSVKSTVARVVFVLVALADVVDAGGVGAGAGLVPGISPAIAETESAVAKVIANTTRFMVRFSES